MILKNVAQNIRFLRESKKITREDLADQLGITVSGLGRIERGETDIPLSRLNQIAKALKTNVSSLIINSKNEKELQESHPDSKLLELITEVKEEAIHYKEKYIKELELEIKRLRNKE